MLVAVLSLLGATASISATDTFSGRILWLDDAAARLTVADVLEIDEGDWSSFRSGLSTQPPAVHWLRLDLETDEQVFLDFFGGWKSVEVWTVEPDGVLLSRGVSSESLPLAARPEPSADLVIPLPAGLTRLAVARLETSSYGPSNPDWLGARVVPASERARQLRSFYVLNGVYSGIVLAVVIYALFLFVATRFRTYLLYVFYSGCFGLTWIAESGFGFEFLWPTLPGFQQQSSYLFPALAAFCGTWFGRTFLDSKRFSPKLDRALAILQVAVLVSVACFFAGLRVMAEVSLGVLALAIVAVMAPVVMRGLRAGFKPAQIFLFANGPLMFFVVLYTLGYFGWLERTFLVEHGAQVSSALEKVILAFGLASRMNLLEEGKLRSDRASRRSLQKQVEERTQDLEGARKKLEVTNNALVEVNLQLAELSTVDGLTGVANRRQFDAVLQTEWARCNRHQASLCLLLADVDLFKQFNDSQGHLAGDDCLVKVAQALESHCQRAGDLVARYGGEEFAVILPATESEESEKLADLLRLEIESLSIEHQASEISDVVTISIGSASMVPSADTTPLDLIRSADRALYQAKRSGRNRVAAA